MIVYGYWWFCAFGCNISGTTDNRDTLTILKFTTMKLSKMRLLQCLLIFFSTVASILSFGRREEGVAKLPFQSVIVHLITCSWFLAVLLQVSVVMRRPNSNPSPGSGMDKRASSVNAVGNKILEVRSTVKR